MVVVVDGDEVGASGEGGICASYGGHPPLDAGLWIILKCIMLDWTGHAIARGTSTKGKRHRG